MKNRIYVSVLTLPILHEIGVLQNQSYMNWSYLKLILYDTNPCNINFLCCSLKEITWLMLKQDFHVTSVLQIFNSRWQLELVPGVHSANATICQGLRDTSCHFLFEFLFMTTQGSAQTESGFRFVVKFQVGIHVSICHGEIFS